MQLKMCLLVSASTLLFTPCAYAQTSAPPPASPASETSASVTSDQGASSTDSGDIVVTAQRREQRLQDVPVAVSVASGVNLQRANISNLEQLSVRLPAVRINQAPASDILYIRGTGSGLNGGFEQSVATFVDGLYRGRARSTRAALFDIERVEVLKGPQTTFFGNNAIAGAFNITTRKPGRDFAINGLALYQPSDKEYKIEGGINIPLTPTLAVRLAGQASGMDGYVHNANLDRNEPRLRDWIVRGVVSWQPIDALDTTLRIDHGQNRDRGVYSGELTNCPAPAAYGAPAGACAAYLALRGAAADTTLDRRSDTGDSLFNYDFTEVSLSNALSLGDYSLNFLTGYFQHHAVNLSNVIPVPNPGVFGATTRFPVGAEERFDQFSQEIRLTSPDSAPFSYMIGTYFSRGELNYRSSIGYFFAPFANAAQPNFPAAVPVTSLGLTDQKERTLSGFASLKYRFSEALSLSGALRYTSVRKRASRNQQLGVSSGAPFFDNFVPGPIAGQAVIFRAVGASPANFPFGERTDNAWMPSATLQYKFSPRFMTYASYTRGFKAGGFSVLSSETFNPEHVDAYEIGAKGTAFGVLSFNVALFLSNYKDLQEASQVLSPTGVPTFMIGNSAASRTKGIEFGGSLPLFEGVRLSADVAYLDSRYVDYKNGPCTTLGSATAGCVQDLSGARRAFAPKFSGNVALSIVQPIGDLSIRIDPVVAFTSSYLQQSFNDPLYLQPGYAKFDLRVAIGPQSEKWEVALVGRNLTDKQTASFRNAVPTSPGSVLALPDRGRTVAIQASFKM